jgi:hypothetical protein
MNKSKQEIRDFIKHLPKDTPILRSKEAIRFFTEMLENEDNKVGTVATPKLDLAIIHLHFVSTIRKCTTNLKYLNNLLDREIKK